MEHQKSDGPIKDGAAGEQKGYDCLCKSCLSFQHQLNCFVGDRFFGALLESLEKFRERYRQMPMNAAVHLIFSHLQMCNVGRGKSGSGQLDLIMFSFYLYNVKVL
ncbi:MAG: hypothetical protein ABIN91_02910 [Mucilaginibacter sp.]|uniref:hypothetical protein n=1 Tax=Mucilaginibacter sp. TaxID=1882438 RepID=UPI003266B561